MHLCPDLWPCRLQQQHIYLTQSEYESQSRYLFVIPILHDICICAADSKAALQQKMDGCMQVRKHKEHADWAEKKYAELDR